MDFNNILIFCMLNTYVITTKMKLFHSSKAVRPRGGGGGGGGGGTLMYTLFVLIYDL